MDASTWIWVLVAVAAALLLVWMYNTLVARRNNVENAFAGIDTQLKKRCDLVPNLVATVKGYAGHERAVLERLTELRTAAAADGLGREEAADIRGSMSPLFREAMAQVEAYPELKASAPFTRLQRQLAEIEEQLSAARRAYNAAVTEYNNGVQMVPLCLFAAVFGFKRRTWFLAEESDRATPATDFGAPGI